MSTPTPVQQVCLVLSPYAADELAGLIERGGYVADAVAGHPRVLDGIAIECRTQLATTPTTDEQLDVGAIAARMAEAAAKAVKAAA